MFEDSIISDCSTLCPSNMNVELNLYDKNRKAIDISGLQSITDLQRSGKFTPHDPSLCECLNDPRNGGDVR